MYEQRRDGENKAKTEYVTNKGPVLEMPHAEVVNVHKIAYFKVGRLLFHWHLSSSFLPIASISLGCLFSINQSVSHPVCLSFPLILSVFQSFSIYPPTHTLTHIYILIHTSSIAIPERSRLVWQWLGLCP